MTKMKNAVEKKKFEEPLLTVARIDNSVIVTSGELEADNFEQYIIINTNPSNQGTP